jgi:phosphoenolpyruvate carboxylase
MTDNDRQAQKEAATRKLLSAYAKLVGMTAEEIANGGEAQRLTEAIDAMTETTAKAMLIARIATDAVRANEITDDEPTLN